MVSTYNTFCTMTIPATRTKSTNFRYLQGITNLTCRRPKINNVLYICKKYWHGLTNSKTQCY
jgi:hypothetical protein